MLAYYYVVDELNPQQIPGRAKPLRHVPICRTRLQIPARMIMRHDNASGAVGDSIGEDLPRVDEARSERANSDDAFGNQAIGAVEREANEVFLLFVTNVAQLFDGFFGTVDDWSLANFKLTAPELKASHNLRGLGRTETFDIE